jgi:hypothetical protein
MLFPAGSTRVPVEEIMCHDGGRLFDQFARMEVLPRFEGMDDRLQLMPEGVAEEIDVLVRTPVGIEGGFGAGGAFTHLLTSRRNKYVYNSMCHELPQTAKGNPAYLHPGDIAQLGACSGDVVRLISAHGAINVQLAEDAALRPGVVSVSHAFGGAVMGEAGDQFATVSQLLSTDNTLDRIARMPIMSAVPVRFERI